MTRIFAATFVVAGLAFAPAFASGENSCLQDVRYAEKLFREKMPQLTPQQQDQIRDRLDLAPTSCLSLSYPNSAQASGVSDIIAMLSRNSQVAATENGESYFIPEQYQ